jgi:Asp-tRNA(Asn)/Glu-tRNA(Gln) amidotransferase C subunit
MTKQEKAEILYKRAKFTLTSDELEHFLSDFSSFEEMTSIFDIFDLTDVLPATRPFNVDITSDDLRPDDVIANNASNVLKQAEASQDDFILLEIEDV